MMKGRLSVIEMTAGDDVAENLSRAESAVTRAAEAGAGLVVLPENFAFLGADEQAKFAVAEYPGAGPVQEWLTRTAADCNIWLVGGSVPLWGERDGRVRAASLVSDPAGRIRARYDKIHLFDVRLDAGESYCESATFEPGEAVSWVDTPYGRLGLAVCYDIRFPELFRALADAGCELVALPSAFTVTTGAAHWETLVRARAIENGYWLLAPGQVGRHPGGRRTWGHSLVVDPWGVAIAQGNGPGPVLAEYRADAVAKARERIPALTHRRPKVYQSLPAERPEDSGESA